MPYPAATSPTIDLETLIESRASDAVRRRVLFWCLAAMFLDGYDFNLLAFVGPALIAHFGISKAAFGLAQSAGVVGFAIGAFLLSSIGDRFGRKRMLIAGMVVFGALTIACAFSTSLTMLAAFRFLTGIGLGGALPNAVALTADYAKRGAKATATGILFVGYAIGGAAPGWIAGWLLPSFGWQAVFIIGGLPALIAVPFMAVSMPESIRFLAATERRRDALQRSLDRFHPGHDLPANARLLVTADHETGLPVRLLFTDHRAWTTVFLWLSFIASTAGIFFTISWTPTVVASMGLTGSHAAYVGAMFGTGGTVGCFAVPRLIDKIGMPGLVTCEAIAAICIWLIGQVGTSELELMAMVTVAGFMGSGSQAGIASISGTLYPASVRSTGVGWAFGVARVGAIAAPIIGGALLGAGITPSSMFGVAALFLTVSVVSLTLLTLQSRRVHRPAFP